MKTILLILIMMNGNVINIPIIESNSINDCYKKFNQITYSKTSKNYKGTKQQATFYKGNEVFMYSCIWEK